MRFSAFLFNSTLLAGSALAWRGPLPRAEPTGSSPPVPSPSPSSGEPPSPGGPVPTPGGSGPSPSGSPGGPKCGKGYTYCGYMLTSSGHNFGSTDISKAYCNGLQELCANGKPKTDVSEAVFVCMNDQPSTVELLCACGGKCRNDAETNFIAHCDKPCINN
ncbi:hypothetical protein F4781DRAFT_428970 [Annulohypoxylon bovei var. microspora]|nr:hypothetical protein F4781DRAFT_428970 [Annulohypoxylon bovei var. microspora]